ncbi:interleukin 17-like protein [Haliotis rubra]|uniref:interleukin 17-like protein n=1 Tax=Haliotis rubra TaxID=36100 RepID=UPI001EE5374E|nr:interleukin 17-like protein [Haliotis rubra]
MNAFIVIVCYLSIILPYGAHCAKLRRTKMCHGSSSYKYDESMLTLGTLIPDIKNATSTYTRDSEERTLILSLVDWKCPKRLTTSSVLCPHYFVLNYDHNRIPAIVYEARCKCRNCLQSHIKKCLPLYHFRYVLLKDTTSDCYVRKVKAFAVGCQCHTHSLAYSANRL